MATQPQDASASEVNDGKKSPLVTFQVPGSPGSTIELAIWGNRVKVDDSTEATQLAVSFKRSYRADGKWKTTSSYRLHDVFALKFLLDKAADWMLENRDNT